MVCDTLDGERGVYERLWTTQETTADLAVALPSLRVTNCLSRGFGKAWSKSPRRCSTALPMCKACPSVPEGGNQAVVELANESLKTSGTRRITTRLAIEFDNGSHCLPFRSPTETDQTIPSPAHLSLATSAFRTMKGCKWLLVWLMVLPPGSLALLM